MCRALGNQELPLGTFAGQLVDETVGVVDAATPVAVKVLQRFGLADAGVAVALNVLDEGVDALQGLLVFQLPARVFIPGAWGEDDLHRGLPYASMSSWACPLPRSSERIDFARTRWLASDQKGSGLSVSTSKGRRRRMTDWRRKSRMALDMSSPAFEKRVSASWRRLESMRTCSDDVVILKSFVVQMVYSIRFMANERKTAKLPQIAQMRRKRRHGYPRIGEGIGVYRCPSKTVSDSSVVKNGVEGIHHRWHRCGASADTDIHG